MTSGLQQRSVNGALYRRRRRFDPIEWLIGLMFGGAVVCSFLLVLAFSLSAIWLIIVLLEDIARRLAS